MSQWTSWHVLTLLLYFFLQPRNIFLQGHECHVKIGDFGLACTDIVMNENEQLPSSSHVNGNTGEICFIMLTIAHTTPPFYIVQ